jgi:hypothetical protein
MIDRVRAVVIPQMDAGTWDPDKDPLILEWSDQFHGLNGRSGFASDPPIDQAAVRSPARFRFVSAGMSYSNDELYIDDEGIFHRTEASEEDGDGDDDGDDDGEEEVG